MKADYPLDRCRCAEIDDGSCEFCQAYYAGEIDLMGNLTNYGLSLLNETPK